MYPSMVASEDVFLEFLCEKNFVLFLKNQMVNIIPRDMTNPLAKTELMNTKSSSNQNIAMGIKEARSNNSGIR